MKQRAGGNPEKHPIGKGRRVLLTAAEDRYARDWIAAMRGSRSLHRPWMETGPTYERKKVYDSWRGIGKGDTRRAYLAWMREDPQLLVGAFALSEIVRGNFLSCYMGYWANEEFAGRGLMGDGLELVVDQAFRTEKLHRIEANIQPENTRSTGLVRSCGFQSEGISPRYLKIRGRWRDHEHWVLLREDWPRARRARAERTRG